MILMREWHCNILGLLALATSALIYLRIANESIISDSYLPTYYDTLGIDFNEFPNETSYSRLVKYWNITTCDACKEITGKLNTTYSTLANSEAKSIYDQVYYVIQKLGFLKGTDGTIKLNRINFYNAVGANPWIIFLRPIAMNSLNQINSILRHANVDPNDSILLKKLSINPSTKFFIYTKNHIVQFEEEFDINTYQQLIISKIQPTIPVMTYDSTNQYLGISSYVLQKYEMPIYKKPSVSYSSLSEDLQLFEYLVQSLIYDDRIEFSLITPIDRIRVLKRFKLAESDQLIYSYTDNQGSKLRRIINSYKTYTLNKLISIAALSVSRLDKGNLMQSCRNTKCAILLYSSESLVRENMTDVMPKFYKTLYSSSHDRLFTMIDLDWNPKLKQLLNVKNGEIKFILYDYNANAYAFIPSADYDTVLAYKWNTMKQHLVSYLEDSNSFSMHILLNSGSSCPIMLTLLLAIIGIYATRNFSISKFALITAAGALHFLLASAYIVITQL